jgi:hypothetical protein
MKRGMAARKLQRAITKAAIPFMNPADRKAEEEKVVKIQLRMKNDYEAEKQRRLDGDADAIKAHADKRIWRMGYYTANKNARAVGDEKALALHAKHVEKYAVLRNRLKQACINQEPWALIQHAYELTLRQRNRDKRNVNLAELFLKSGQSLSTEFGLGLESRSDEVKERVEHIMKSSAGGLHPNGEATCNNWVRDHGDYMSVEDVLATKEYAAYFLVTMQQITPGEEGKCKETYAFMTEVNRNPMLRIDTVDSEGERDFKRFNFHEAKSVVKSYALAECVSAYDVTTLEGELQHYMEDELGLPHGICLHKTAGAGARSEFSLTPIEASRLANKQKCVYSLVLSLIRTESQAFADVDPVDADRAPPLKSFSVTSHDGKTVHNVCVCGAKQKFPETSSVVSDSAKIKELYRKTSERRSKRKRSAENVPTNE